MTGIDDLRAFFEDGDYKIIIAADGETRSHRRQGSRIVEQTPAGGVSVAFDVLCQAAHATYIARAKTTEDREVVDSRGKVQVNGPHGDYTLKRLFLTPEEEEAYYAGFANQTLWPLCHVAFERPTFSREWFDGYVEINKRFAESIEAEIEGKTFIWINDYHLAMVPSFLRKRKDTVVSLFWHIPWPTWEIFRILPYKREILESLLHCDYLAFHRHYQARNFVNAVDLELGARISAETNTIYVDNQRLRADNLPMGIDVDVIRDALAPTDEKPTLLDSIRATFGFPTQSETAEGEEQPSEQEQILSDLATRYRILLGVDRLDYTKGIPERLMGLDFFFERYPEYLGKVVYIGVMSPTRDAVPAYQTLREQVQEKANEINQKYETGDWQPLHMIYDGFTRDDVMGLYATAAACLVTPVDDGMNLVSKEFVVAASITDDPGMLVLSQFAGSAVDLSASVLVNPYDSEAVADAIKLALEMDPAEKRERIDHMVSLLEDHNVYQWAMSFVRNAITAEREQQHEALPVL